MNPKNYFIFLFVFFMFLTGPSVLADGGGGVDCPEDPGPYSLIPGMAKYRLDNIEKPSLLTIAVLSCPYSTQEPGLKSPTETQAIFLVSGKLTQDQVDNYDCGGTLTRDTYPFAVNSTTHFASVGFSSPELIEAAQILLSLVEGPSIANLCKVSQFDKPVSVGGGGGNSFVPEPEITSASAATLSFNLESGLLETNLRDKISPKIVNPSDTLSLRFNLHQDAGINLIEHVSIHFNQNEIQPSVFEADDTFIRYQKGKTLEINDPNGLFKFADFAIIPQDSYNSIFQFLLEFSGPTDTYDIFLWAWDLDKNAVRETFPNAIIVSESFVPNWIKNNAGWWSSNQITDDDFANGIQYLINEGIIIVPISEEITNSSNQIPGWVKNNAGWWAEDLISEKEFVNAIQYLISIGVISII